jgi:hypothetical protein
MNNKGRGRFHLKVFIVSVKIENTIHYGLIDLNDLSGGQLKVLYSRNNNLTGHYIN